MNNESDNNEEYTKENTIVIVLVEYQGDRADSDILEYDKSEGPVI